MHIQRLKFAYARGARIQVRLRTGTQEWVDALVDGKRYLYVNPNYTFRVHPDDAHLEYGPLSTALRTFAMSQGDERREMHAAAYFAFRDITERIADYGTMSDYFMTMLFVAEYLADQGL